MAGRVIKRLLAGVLTVAVVIPGNFVPAQAAEEPQEDYIIYPNPHKVEYQEGDYILGKELNVIYDKGIDEATKNRLQEAADLKGIEVNEAEQPKEGATNVYVGVHGQDGTAEDYITEEYQPLFFRRIRLFLFAFLHDFITYFFSPDKQSMTVYPVRRTR